MSTKENIPDDLKNTRSPDEFHTQSEQTELPPSSKCNTFIRDCSLLLSCVVFYLFLALESIEPYISIAQWPADPDRFFITVFNSICLLLSISVLIDYIREKTSYMGIGIIVTTSNFTTVLSLNMIKRGLFDHWNQESWYMVVTILLVVIAFYYLRLCESWRMRKRWAVISCLGVMGLVGLVVAWTFDRLHGKRLRGCIIEGGIWEDLMRVFRLLWVSGVLFVQMEYLRRWERGLGE